MIRPIDPTDEATARHIVEIQRAAYAVEAALIGFNGIPQLSETAEQVRDLGRLYWRGAFDDHLLVGLIAWERIEQNVEIDRLAVNPARARQGYGRRLVQAVPADRTVTVSTGAGNTPAVNLYLQEGFEQVGSREIAPGVLLAQFQRAA